MTIVEGFEAPAAKSVAKTSHTHGFDGSRMVYRLNAGTQRENGNRVSVPLIYRKSEIQSRVNVNEVLFLRSFKPNVQKPHGTRISIHRLYRTKYYRQLG